MNDIMTQLALDEKCTGCMACRNICPVDAISSVQNKHGFYRPEVNNSMCINCKKCKLVCPQINPQIINNNYEYENQKFYAFKHNDEVRKNSSSGGVFTWISDYVLSNNGVVFGCVVDTDLKIIHIEADNYSKRDRMRGSKYVQSDVGVIYRNVKKYLQQGRMVLFTGTPCQCEALYSFLGGLSESENLFTLDFICEGGASPKAYKEFLGFYEKKNKIKIYDIFFRDKNSFNYDKNLTLSRRLIVYGKKNGKEEFCFNRNTNNRFHDCLFLCGLQQKACEKCKFHSYNHCADITCGDFHRYDLENDFKDDLGLSEILVNSRKAQSLVDRIDLNEVKILECSKEDAWQPLLEKDMNVWKLKKLFWRIFMRHGFGVASKLIIPHIIKVNCIRKMRKIKHSIRNK